MAHGLVERDRLLGQFRRRLTPAGAAAQSCIAREWTQARTIPALLRSDPTEVAAVAFSVDGSTLTVEELQRLYRQLSKVIRPVFRSGMSLTVDGTTPAVEELQHLYRQLRRRLGR